MENEQVEEEINLGDMKMVGINEICAYYYTYTRIHTYLFIFH